MATCDSRLAVGFLRNCERPISKAGIKRKWYGNFEDIDRAATQLATDGMVISKLVLKPEKKLYPVEGGKKLSSASYALSITDYGNGYIHTDKYTLTQQNATHLSGIRQLISGARVFSIIEKLDRGVNAETAFWVYGFESGMQLTEHTGSTVENGGSDLLTVATQEGEEEFTPPKIFLDKSFDDTLKWITDNAYKPES